MKHYKKYILIMIVVIMCISCKTEKKTENVVLTNEFFFHYTDLNKMINKQELKINDSMASITGFLNECYITGFIDNEKNHIKWWTILRNSQDNYLNIKIEYNSMDKKNNINQYLHYDKGNNIQRNISKYYLKETSNELNKTNVYYKFNMPHIEKVLNQAAKFDYLIIKSGEIISQKNVTCSKINDFYTQKISINRCKDPIFIVGSFYEVYEEKPGEIVVNEIFIRDTIPPQ